MQKVVGSSPIIRFAKAPLRRGFLLSMDVTLARQLLAGAFSVPAFKLVWSRVKEHADPARHSSTVRSSEAIAAPARLPLAAAAGGLTLENMRTATPAGVQVAR